MKWKLICVSIRLLAFIQGTGNREQRHLLYLGRPQDRNGLGTERKIEALSLTNYLFLTAEGSKEQAPAFKAGERVTFAGDEHERDRAHNRV
jgi:hypothetical protein